MNTLNISTMFDPLGQDASGVPILPAFENGRQLWVFCFPCRRFHYHGAVNGGRTGDGWRSSHCGNGTRYTYSLRNKGKFTTAIEDAANKCSSELRHGLREIPAAIAEKIDSAVRLRAQ